jgi:hypothetical protein
MKIRLELRGSGDVPTIVFCRTANRSNQGRSRFPPPDYNAFHAMMVLGGPGAMIGRPRRTHIATEYVLNADG